MTWAGFTIAFPTLSHPARSRRCNQGRFRRRGGGRIFHRADNWSRRRVNPNTGSHAFGASPRPILWSRTGRPRKQVGSPVTPPWFPRGRHAFGADELGTPHHVQN